MSISLKNSGFTAQSTSSFEKLSFFSQLEEKNAFVVRSFGPNLMVKLVSKEGVSPL